MRADVERLADALDHAQHAGTAQASLTPDMLTGARDVLQAILLHIIVIGEALHYVSLDVQSLAPDLPWKAAWSTRIGPWIHVSCTRLWSATCRH
jgi:uncharacterized protein with HEPN domain